MRSVVTLDEIESIYASPEDRYIVSLIVGYQDEDWGIKGASPRMAGRAALDLTTDLGSSDTIWCVYDRQTKTMHQYTQDDLMVEENTL